MFWLRYYMCIGESTLIQRPLVAYRFYKRCDGKYGSDDGSLLPQRVSRRWHYRSKPANLDRRGLATALDTSYNVSVYIKLR